MLRTGYWSSRLDVRREPHTTACRGLSAPPSGEASGLCGLLIAVLILLPDAQVRRVPSPIQLLSTAGSEADRQLARSIEAFASGMTDLAPGIRIP